MARVLLVHWNADELPERAERVRRCGHEVEAFSVTPTPISNVVALAPDVVVIDISRLPSHGREVAMALRESKKTRALRFVFVDGKDDKIERMRATLPDATYVSWRGIAGGIKRALKLRTQKPMVPSARPGGYSGTPLPKKLGIKANMNVALLNAPDGFGDTLGTLPDGVSLRHDARGKRALTLWFVTSMGELLRRMEKLAAQVGSGGLWILWPKKTSPLATDVTQNDVRSAGLQAGLVDYKICAVDADWSGLKFSERRKKR